MRDFIVHVKRGLYLRTHPIVHPSTIAGVAPYGKHFYAVSGSLRKLDGQWWAQNGAGLYMMIANGRNAYVTENNRPFNPLS